MSTSEHGNGPDENEVRDLLAQLGNSLADSRDPQPIPPEVDERIMAALAELPAPATEADGEPEVVVPLERPRRRVGGWLVAAALLVAVAGGGWALAHRSGSDGATTMSTAGGAAADSGATALAQGGRRALPSVSLAHFDKDVRVLLGTTPNAASAQGLDQLTPDDPGAKAQLRAPGAYGEKGTKDFSPPAPELATGLPDCARPAGVAGRQVEVSIDGRLGQLMVSTSEGKRVVTAYDCSGRRQLATVTLP